MPNLITGSVSDGSDNCYQHRDVNDGVPPDFRAPRDVNTVGTPRYRPDNFQATKQNMLDQNLIVGLVVLAVLVLAVYAYAPKFRSMLSGFEGFQGGAPKLPAKPLVPGAKLQSGGTAGGSKNAQNAKAAIMAQNAHVAPAPAAKATEQFADYASVGEELGPVPMAGAQKPQGCYPRQQLNPMELLPSDQNSQWAAANPVGSGDIQGKNFLSAGALIGINTVGQSLRNANLQLRAEPPNPQVAVGPWQQSTIEPDLQRRPLE